MIIKRFLPHITKNLEELEGELKSTSYTLTAIALFGGFLVQMYQLGKIRMLPFFSWSQVLNDFVSIFGVFLVCGLVVLLLSQYFPVSKLISKFHTIVLIFTPFFVVRYLLALLDIIEIHPNALEKAVVFFGFIFISFICLLFIRHWIVEFVAYWKNIKNEKWSKILSGDAIKKTLLFAYYVLIIWVSILIGINYMKTYYAYYFVYDNKIFYVSYLNDAYVFAEMPDGSHTAFFREKPELFGTRTVTYSDYFNSEIEQISESTRNIILKKQ